MTRARRPVVEVIDETMAQVLRRKSGAERLRIAMGMFRTARTMITQAVRQQHPDWSETRVRDEVNRRLSHGSC